MPTRPANMSPTPIASGMVKAFEVSAITDTPKTKIAVVMSTMMVMTLVAYPLTAPLFSQN